jgi:hypothetical protein
MDSLIIVSAAVGMCIGTSLCCFWFSAETQGCRDLFLGVGSFALLIAGICTSHVSRFYEEALKDIHKIHSYSVIPKVDSRDSLSTIAEEDVEI